MKTYLKLASFVSLAMLLLVPFAAYAQGATQTAANVTYTETATVIGQAWSVTVKAVNNLPPSTPGKSYSIPTSVLLPGTTTPFGATFSLTTVPAIDDHITPANLVFTVPSAAGWTIDAPSGTGYTVSGQTVTCIFGSEDGSGGVTGESETVTGKFPAGG